MIMGEKFYGFPGLREGFNFLPGATIVPHFDEISAAFLSPIRLLAGKTLTLLGIEGNTVLFQNHEKYEVLGSGGVTVWNHTIKIRYSQGLLPGW